MKCRFCKFLFVAIVVFTSFGNAVSAQVTQFDEAEILAYYIFTGRDTLTIKEVSRELSEMIRSQKKEYSFRDLFCLSISNHFNDPTSKNNDYEEMKRWFAKITLDFSGIIDKSDDSTKRKLISDYSNAYELFSAVTKTVKDSLTLKDYSFFYKDNVYSRKSLFSLKNKADIFQRLMIIANNYYFHEYIYLDIDLLMNDIDELCLAIDMISCDGVIEKGKYWFAILKVIALYKDKDTSLVETALLITDKSSHIETCTNFFLKTKDFMLLLEKSDRVVNFNNSSYKAIRQSLSSNQCAILIINFYGVYWTSVVINPLFDEPVFDKELKKINQINPSDYLKRYGNFEKVYVSAFDQFEGVDLAYCNTNVYQKFSLSDIVNDKQHDCYKGGIVSVYANIDFGPGKYKSFDEDMLLVDTIKSMFEKKTFALTGNNVKRINFINIIDEVELLHISTHTELVKANKFPEDTLGYYNAVMGVNEEKGYRLLLSSYNIKHDGNYITADFVKDLDLSGLDFVFIDACETGVVSNTLVGNVGIAKSFYLAGVMQIVAFLKEISPAIASDFAIEFYHKLYTSKDRNYHKAFYEAKKVIVDKYCRILPKDIFGRVDLGVVLWE